MGGRTRWRARQGVERVGGGEGIGRRRKGKQMMGGGQVRGCNVAWLRRRLRGAHARECKGREGEWSGC